MKVNKKALIITIVLIIDAAIVFGLAYVNKKEYANVDDSDTAATLTSNVDKPDTAVTLTSEDDDYYGILATNRVKENPPQSTGSQEEENESENENAGTNGSAALEQSSETTD